MVVYANDSLVRLQQDLCVMRKISQGLPGAPLPFSCPMNTHVAYTLPYAHIRWDLEAVGHFRPERKDLAFYISPVTFRQLLRQVKLHSLKTL